MTKRPLSQRLYLALLRLLPEETRSLYASEMETTFETERRATPEGIPMIRLWAETVLDLFRTAPSEHRDILVRDTRYALRTMTARRMQTLTAVLTLGLGIGANVAMFAVVDKVLLEPLPYGSPASLVRISETELGEDPSNLGYLTFTDLRERSHSFDSMVAIAASTATLASGGREAERVNAMRVSWNYFDMLGVHPTLGRSFTEEEDHPGEGRRVVVLSDELWQRRFDADPDLVGATVDISGRDYRVVGVLPAGFDDLVAELMYEGAELWYPLGYDASASFACRTCRHLRVLGRLAPGVSPEAAERDLSTLVADFERQYPSEYHAAGIEVRRLRDVFLGPVRPALLVLWAGVAALLLIACANVANLLLMQASEREHEIAVRAALGVTRARLARQLMTESVLLSSFGGALGLGLAWVAVRLLETFGPAELPRLAGVGIDLRVVLATIVVTGVSGLVFGLAPLRHLARRDLGPAKSSGRRTQSVETWRTRSMLLAGSVALAVVLLVGSGLLVRTMRGLLAVEPGFDPGEVITMQLWATGPRFREGETQDQIATAVRFYEEISRRIEGLAGVEAAAAVSTLPLGGGVDGYSIHVANRNVGNPEAAPNADRFVVTPGFFSTLRIGIERGRWLDERDRQETEPVAVINRTAAAELFPDGEAIGQMVRLGPPEALERRIVGVVNDIRHHGLDVPVGYQVYVPQAQWAWAETFLTLVVRTRVDPESLAGSVREVVRSVDPAQPISHVRAFEEVVRSATATRRFAAGLLSVFALSALALALIGLYSAVGVLVGQRTREIGLRIALGAPASAIRRMVVVRGLRPVAVGLLLGLGGATLSAGALRSLLYGVGTLDPTVFAGTIGLLALAALAACWLPAWRASRIDPSANLRSE